MKRSEDLAVVFVPGRRLQYTFGACGGTGKASAERVNHPPLSLAWYALDTPAPEVFSLENSHTCMPVERFQIARVFPPGCSIWIMASKFPVAVETGTGWGITHLFLSLDRAGFSFYFFSLFLCHLPPQATSQDRPSERSFKALCISSTFCDRSKTDSKRGRYRRARAQSSRVPCPCAQSKQVKHSRPLTFYVYLFTFNHIIWRSTYLGFRARVYWMG